MALKNPDILEHNNPNNAALDSDFIRGGTRTAVANLAALYALVATKSDQMKPYSTRLFVIDQGSYYTLLSLGSANTAAGWLDEKKANLTVERVVPTYTEMEDLGYSELLTDQENIFVEDASQGDSTVTSGWAIYKWFSFGFFAKLIEEEGLDLDITQFTKNVGGENTLNFTPLVAETPSWLTSFIQGGVVSFRNFFILLLRQLVTKADLVQGKVPASQLPIPQTGAVTKMGYFDAFTAMVSATSAGTYNPIPANSYVLKGWYWVTSVAGTYNTVAYAVGDWIVSDGVNYSKVDNTETITKVEGLVGAVALPRATLAQAQAMTDDTGFITPLRLSYFWAGVNKLTGFDAALAGVISATDTFVQAISKLQRQVNSKLSTTMTNGKFVIGNNANLATEVFMGGDANMGSDGILVIGSERVTTGKIGLNAVTNARLAKMSNLTMKANFSGATADPQDISAINLWDGVQAQFYDNERGISRWAAGAIYKQMSDGLVFNTIVPTSLINTTNQIGSNILLAGVPYVGDTFVLELCGRFSVENGTDSLALDIKLGTVVLGSTPAKVFGIVTDAHVYIRLQFTVRTLGLTGTVVCSGFAIMNGLTFGMVITTTALVDFSTSKTLDVLATWDAAHYGNTITAQQVKLSIE